MVVRTTTLVDNYKRSSQGDLSLATRVIQTRETRAQGVFQWCALGRTDKPKYIRYDQ